MPVVGSGDKDGVHVLVLEQAPKILVELGTAADARGGFVEARGIDVAEGYGAGGAQHAVSGAAQIRRGLGGAAGFGAEETAASPADTDVAEVDAVAGSGLREDAARDDVECADARRAG